MECEEVKPYFGEKCHISLSTGGHYNREVIEIRETILKIIDKFSHDVTIKLDSIIAIESLNARVGGNKGVIEKPEKGSGMSKKGSLNHFDAVKLKEKRENE